MIQASENEFSENVLLPSFTSPVAVLFSASWCGPCKVLKPVIHKVELATKLLMVEVDAGEEKELAAFYGIRGVPTIAVFKDGKVLAKVSGALGEAALRSFLTEHGALTADIWDF